MSLTLAELRQKFAAREKSVTLLTGGGLLAEHEALAAELATAMAQTRTSIADGGTVRELGERVADLEAQIAATAVTIRLRGIGRNEFRRLMAEHATDEGPSPWDRDTFPPALIAACSLDPRLTVAEANELADILTDGQWDEVFSAAWDACREVDDVPFSALASAATRD